MSDLQSVTIPIVVADFYRDIAAMLVEGAQDVITSNGFNSSSLFYVPGALEIPVTVKTLIDHTQPPAVVCLGAVIRGETPHFDVVINESARGLMDLSIEYGVPVLNGILTVESREQAFDRLGGAHGHKGRDVAQAAVDMIRLIDQLK